MQYDVPPCITARMMFKPVPAGLQPPKLRGWNHRQADTCEQSPCSSIKQHVRPLTANLYNGRDGAVGAACSCAPSCSALYPPYSHDEMVFQHTHYSCHNDTARSIRCLPGRPSWLRNWRECRSVGRDGIFTPAHVLLLQRGLQRTPQLRITAAAGRRQRVPPRRGAVEYGAFQRQAQPFLLHRAHAHTLKFARLLFMSLVIQQPPHAAVKAARTRLIVHLALHAQVARLGQAPP